MTQPIMILLKTLNAQLPEPENEPDLFELVKTYQTHSHSRKCTRRKDANIIILKGTQ